MLKISYKLLQYTAIGTLHAAQMAIEYVNNEEALLEDYKLNLISVENETAFDSKV